MGVLASLSKPGRGLYSPGPFPKGPSCAALFFDCCPSCPSPSGCGRAGPCGRQSLHGQGREGRCQRRLGQPRPLPSPSIRAARRPGTTLIHRLTRQEDWARVPAVETATLKRMTSGYQVADEKRSTTRYVAEVTYTFNGDLVRRFLQGANIAYADTRGPAAAGDPDEPGLRPGVALAGGLVRHPHGRRRRAARAAGRRRARPQSCWPRSISTARRWSDVQPVASRAHANQAALVLAGPVSAGQMTVRIRLLTPAGSQTLGPITVACRCRAVGRPMWRRRRRRRATSAMAGRPARPSISTSARR